MANLILLNVSKKIIGSVGIMNEIQKSNNTVVYNPTQQFALDILDLATPIRSNPDGSTYFGTRSNKLQAIENRNVALNYWVCTDLLATLVSQTDGLISLTVVKKGLQTINSEIMAFETGKIMQLAGVDPATGYTRFQYLEDGQANQVTYEVTQTPAQMVASGVSPIFNMNGHDLYVNTVVGNDATAEKGNPILPWATATAAIAVANSGEVVVLLEGSHTVVNAYKAGVNIEVRTNAVLNITGYFASGVGNQTIYGGGTINISGTTGFRLQATFDGTVKVDIGTLNINGANGANNISNNSAVFDLTADYVNLGAACLNAMLCGSNGVFNWRVKIKQTDNSTQYANAFLINASHASATIKAINIDIANSNSFSSNQAFLLVSAIDDTYVINLNAVLVYDGSNGSPCFDSVFAAYNCTGGQLIVNGEYSVLKGRLGIIVNSLLLKLTDNSIAYQDTANTESLLAISGGTSIYNFNGNKRSFSHAEGINLGTFTGANNSITFGAIASSGGTDILNFKGAMRQAYINATAIGILVSTGGLIVDGGIVEMTNGVGNDAFSAVAPQNLKIYGTGFTNGVINANLTNIVAGTNIISDPNIVVNV